MTLLLERDIDPRPLAGRRIAVLGYGHQGRAQALNLRDAGHDVCVGVRPGGRSASIASADGWKTQGLPEAATRADVVMMLLPDEHQADVLEGLGSALRPGQALGFAHGFNVTYDRVSVPDGVGLFLVAPCAPGAQLRAAFEAGSGVFAYAATREGDELLPLALAYARAIGCARAGVLVTSFRAETEIDLFGEQAVLCGGLHTLVTAAYETLVESGYEPEMAYLECIHQLVWLAESMHEQGVAGARREISTTALFGDLTRGRRVIGDATRRAMRDALDEIRSGVFAGEFLSASRDGFAKLCADVERLDSHPMEEIGQKLRRRLAENCESRVATGSVSGVDTGSTARLD